jgi:hypothetical protein
MIFLILFTLIDLVTNIKCHIISNYFAYIYDNFVFYKNNLKNKNVNPLYRYSYIFK